MHAVRWLASPSQGELTHMRSMCVGVAETVAEGGRHRLTDEAFINNLQ